MATDDEHHTIAAELWDARRNRATVAPPSARFAGFGLGDGYAVGAQLYALQLRAGEQRVGLKIGFTNTAVWTALGLAEPICAPVYRSSVHYAQDDGEAVVVDTLSLVAPAIEPEIVVGIGQDGITWWALGFEIVHCHYPDWRMTPADALADGALHGALIVGTRLPLEANDPLRAPFGIELLRDGTRYEVATTAAVLGGPLHALDRARAICAHMDLLAAPAPGEIVTTGSLTSAPRINPGESWTVRPDNGTPALQIVVR